MSSWEKLITDSFDKGFDYFKKIPSSILAWWLYKMFYCILVKEYGMKANKADINSKHLISEENMRKYEKFYFYMSSLLKEYKFSNEIPYNVYLFKSNDDTFDYLCDCNSLIYLKLGKIIIFADLDGYGLFTSKYMKEIFLLQSKPYVTSAQMIELFTKIMCEHTRYSFKTESKIFLTSDGVFFSSSIVSLRELSPFNLKDYKFRLLAILNRNEQFDDSKIVTMQSFDTFIK